MSLHRLHHVLHAIIKLCFMLYVEFFYKPTVLSYILYNFVDFEVGYMWWYHGGRWNVMWYLWSTEENVGWTSQCIVHGWNFKGWTVISLLQPAHETYDLNLWWPSCVPWSREYVLDFFESMGFKCPEKKGAIDFLQEVTSKKDQVQYWVSKDQPYRFVTVTELAKGFQSFHIGTNLYAISLSLFINFVKS